MLTIDRQPLPPELPKFNRELEAFLVAAAAHHSARRPRRVRVYSAVAVAAAAVIIVVIVAVAHIGGSGTSPNPSPSGNQLAGFSVSTVSGGRVELSLTPGELKNPGALRRALHSVGVPALVTSDRVCYVPGPSAILNQVLPPPQHQPDGSTVWTITRSAIPSNVELSIGYFHVSSGFGIYVTLVPEHAALICTAGPPTPPHR